MLNFSKRINVKRQQWFLGEGEGVFVTAEKVKEPFIFGKVLQTCTLLASSERAPSGIILLFNVENTGVKSTSVTHSHF